MDTQLMTKKRAGHRFGEFELLKAIAVLGLPAVHIMEEAVAENIVSAGVLKLESFIVAFCIFGPSLFMMCMGFSIGGARTSYESAMRQGLRFLVLGAMLNVLRSILPGIFLTIFSGHSFVEYIEDFLMSDIYFFVGFFYVFYSFMLRLKVNMPCLIAICIVMLTVNSLLTPVLPKYITNDIVIRIVGNFLYIDESSCFPLMSWAIFPSVGILLGEVLKKAESEKRAKIMKYMLILSSTTFLSFLAFLWLNGFNLLNALVAPINAYITDLPNVILMITLAFILFGSFYYLCKVIDETAFMSFMVKISTYIVPFYMVQWVIVSWFVLGCVLFNVEVINLALYAVSATVITGISIFVAVKHGMKCVKFLAKITSVKRWRKRRKSK